MFKQPRLISDVNFDLAKEQQKKELRVYEKLCGFLKLEDLFAVDSVYICAARCASGFYHKADTQTFMKRPWESAYNLCKQVLSEKFRPTYYHTHNIIERGKRRTIKPPTFIKFPPENPRALGPWDEWRVGYIFYHNDCITVKYMI